jgi:hypothetical protein
MTQEAALISKALIKKVSETQELTLRQRINLLKSLGSEAEHHDAYLTHEESTRVDLYSITLADKLQEEEEKLNKKS